MISLNSVHADVEPLMRIALKPNLATHKYYRALSRKRSRVTHAVRRKVNHNRGTLAEPVRGTGRT